MRSYEAARRLFSFLGGCAWVVIVLGGVVVFFGFQMANELAGSRSTAELGVLGGALGIVFGLTMSFLGFLMLALVQMGRASVDTAELTQQMLKVARDQLEVSQQALHGSNAPTNSFAEAAAAIPGTASAYNDLPKASHEENTADLKVEQSGDLWRVGDQEFKSLDTAKLYLATVSAEADEGLSVVSRRSDTGPGENN